MNSTSADISQPELTDREFSLFRDLIFAKTGIALRDTKCPMLSARLQRRLRHLNLSSFGAYYQLLVSQDTAGDERRELINCITTNKTSFFREPHHFSFLADVFKRSLASSASTAFKVWSAACSTGEEPFTMAMTLRDVLDQTRVTREHSILATDIDTQVLQFGRASIYLESDLPVVPQPFRQRFFLKGSGSQVGRYRVKPEIRDIVDFRQLNLIDPSWDVNAPFDVIFCRNALIYFDHETQNRIVRRLIAYLKPRGYLMVGHSEQLHSMTDVLELAGTTIYRVKDGV